MTAGHRLPDNLYDRRAPRCDRGANMDPRHDLRFVLAAIRRRVVDPSVLADLAADWSPDDSPSFTRFVVDRGIITPGQVRELEAVPDGGATRTGPGEGGHARSLTALRPVEGGGDATASFRGAGGELEGSTQPTSCPA